LKHHKKREFTVRFLPDTLLCSGIEPVGSSFWITMFRLATLAAQHQICIEKRRFTDPDVHI